VIKRGREAIGWFLVGALGIGVAEQFLPARIVYAVLGLVWLFCFGLPWLLRVGLPWVAREGRGLPQDARYHLGQLRRRGHAAPDSPDDRARGPLQPPAAR
jgi:hypothetical protein